MTETGDYFILFYFSKINPAHTLPHFFKVHFNNIFHNTTTQIVSLPDGLHLVWNMKLSESIQSRILSRCLHEFHKMNSQCERSSSFPLVSSPKQTKGLRWNLLRMCALRRSLFSSESLTYTGMKSKFPAF